MTDDLLSPAEAVVAAHLRRTFAVIADATPSVDRRTELLAALDDRERRRRVGPAARRLVPVAAALLLVGAAVVALAARAGDDGTERAGPGGADDTGSTVGAGPVDDPDLATGWYLPEDGWTVTDVDLSDLGGPAPCPCRLLAAARPGRGDAAVLDVVETGIREVDPAPGWLTPLTNPQPWDLPEDEAGTAVDVGGRAGRAALHPGDGTRRTVSVDVGGRRITATGRHVSEGDLLAVVDGWADAVDAGRDLDPAALPLPDGFVPSALQVRGPSDLLTVVAVTAVEDATGARVEYQLVPTGYQRSYLLAADTAVVDAGAPDGGAIAFGGDTEDGPVAGAVGGPVDVTAGPSYFGRSTTDLDRGRLDTFLASLREVSTDEWRAALPDPPAAGQDVRTAPTLFDPPLTG